MVALLVFSSPLADTVCVQMKTYERSRATFWHHCTMESHKTTYRRSAFDPRDKPVIHDILLTLEELSRGCTKRMKIVTKVFNDNLIVERTEEKIVRLDVPPGSRDGTEVVIPCAGDKKPGKIPGDVIFVIREREHAVFTRDDEDNLIHKVDISLRDALTGCNVQIPLLCGESLTLSTDDVVCHGARKRIPGKGMPRGGGRRGDLLVDFSVIFPAELTENQKHAINSTLPD